MTASRFALKQSTEDVRAVANRVLADLDVIVPRMGQAYRDEIPEYASLPEELMSLEVLRISRRIVEEFFNRAVLGQDLQDTDVRATVRGAGRRRLEMGVPLEAGLHAFRIAGRVVWEVVVEAVRPGEEPALAQLAAQWIDFVDRVSTAFAEGYIGASHDHLRRLDARRRAIVDALLDARTPGDASAVAAEYSLSLAAAYAPVLIGGADITARIDALLAVAPKDTLAGFRGERVLLLIPGAVRPASLQSLATASASVCVWGSPRPVGDGLGDEVRHVGTVLEAARATGHTEGVFGPDDLLLAQLLSGHGRVADQLRERVLRPLVERDPDGVFRATLRTYAACGSVPETAEAEVVHPNTVAYRLKRVKELTGLDPRVPDESTLLVLALNLDVVTLHEGSQP
ncbi:MAG TPA: helix-turn-helix domain-containing protein [Nitriliruptorales bacterium]